MPATPFIPARVFPARVLPEPVSAVPASIFPGRDFSAPARPPPEPPPEPRFGPRDLAEARADGFRQGHDAGRGAGLAEAASAHRAMEVAALGHIAEALAAGQAAAAAVADQAAAALADSLVAALRAAMPDLLRRAALGEAEAMLALILPGLAREPLVTVEVFGPLAPGVAAAVARLAPDRNGRVAVAARADFAAGEVRVGWDRGHASRRPAELWRDIFGVLEAALGLAADGVDDNGPNDGGRQKETGHGQ
jgi:hypothetical protein